MFGSVHLPRPCTCSSAGFWAQRTQAWCRNTCPAPLSSLARVHPAVTFRHVITPGQTCRPAQTPRETYLPSPTMHTSKMGRYLWGTPLTTTPTPLFQGSRVCCSHCTTLAPFLTVFQWGRQMSPGAVLFPNRLGLGSRSWESTGSETGHMEGSNQNPNFLFHQFIYLCICPHALKPHSGKNLITDRHEKQR